MNIIQYYSFVVIFTMFKGGGALLRWLLVGDLTFWIQQGGKLHGMQTECTLMLQRIDIEGKKLPNMASITKRLICFHWTLGVAIRPADVARIKKHQEHLFWYRVDIEWTDRFDFFPRISKSCSSQGSSQTAERAGVFGWWRYSNAGMWNIIRQMLHASRSIKKIFFDTEMI